MIIGIVICTFIVYHFAYEIGKLAAHIENN
jgi:hypothetical protein